ncbi:MAG: heavy metal translocating P-type ATPase, partial [Candidatus Sericytochromatia bacterium]
VLVRPGERVPVDGAIVSGQSALDQSPITGESMPVVKAVGETVFAGSINGAGALEVRVSRRAEDTTIARIIHMVEEAQASRAPSQAFIDRFAAVYTPIVLVAAMLVATVPPAFFDVELGDWIYRGLALLVLACPCALVVSTPVALATAIGGAARRGLLIKGGLPLEAAAKIKVVAFDKTGTLTEGRPEVRRLAPVTGRTPEEVLALAAAVEAMSEHPVAEAIVRHAAAQGVAYAAATDFQATVGHGASATVGGRRVHVGSARYFATLGVPLGEAEKLVDRFQNEGTTAIVVAVEQEVCGAIAVADDLRPAARRVVLALNELGLKPVAMLTGDHTQTARAIGQLAGVDEIKAELLPEDKVGALKQLIAKHGPAMMVGDGINDAPALATADVSVAMGRGTDVAIETADIAIMNDDLTRLPYMIRLSRETMAIIHQNIAFSIGIKVVAVVAIFPGWLTLWLAVLADMGATILVTLNGLRLLSVKPEER